MVIEMRDLHFEDEDNDLHFDGKNGNSHTDSGINMDRHVKHRFDEHVHITHLNYIILTIIWIELKRTCGSMHQLNFALMTRIKG